MIRWSDRSPLNSDIRSCRPVIAAGRRAFSGLAANERVEPSGPYPAHLASRPGAKGRASRSIGARRRRASAGRSSAPCRSSGKRNVIGTHGGSYALYRALAVSSGALDPIRRPDLTNTHPPPTIGPFPQWTEPEKIVSLDPVGASGRGRVQAGDRRRPRHPPEHRHHARAARPDRDPRCAGRRPAEGRRPRHPCQRQRVGGQDRDRSGLVSAGHRRSASAPPRPRCAATCSSRPPACSPSW